MSKILTLLLFIYILYCQDEILFYHTMKKYCKKNNGKCENCDCWSCPRKLYIDEYLENRSKKGK